MYALHGHPYICTLEEIYRYIQVLEIKTFVHVGATKEVCKIYESHKTRDSSDEFSSFSLTNSTRFCLCTSYKQTGSECLLLRIISVYSLE